MRALIPAVTLLLALSSCGTHPEPEIGAKDSQRPGTSGTRPPDESPVNDTLTMLRSSVIVTESYADFHHTFVIRSVAGLALPDCDIVYGLGHDRAAFPNNQFSFGAGQLGEYYDEKIQEDTLVVTLRAPFWFLFSRVPAYADYSKKVACEDAYEAGDTPTLMRYESEAELFYRPFPAALINGRLLFDLSSPTIGGEHLAHS